MSSAVTPQLVQKVFELYLEDKLVVNRRYQRKLVWTIDEKEKFIDSLASGYPIPLILTSKQEKNSTSIENLEILDGLQRLNAIVSFIENDFPLKGKYFDLESTSVTKNLKPEINQKQPILDNKTCSAILNYQIPFLTTLINTPEFIDETFRRINTGGRRLSMQDVRQAGSLGIIPDTINKISNYVRKDSSRTEIVTLKNMKNISIGDKKLNYGININDIFWVRGNIIGKSDIRESRDEELISHLLSYVLMPEESHTTSEYLNKIYDSSTIEHNNLANALEKYKDGFIIKSFNYIFDELNKIFKDGRPNFSDTVFHNVKNKQKSSRCFQVIFLSIYELIINESMSISNYKDLHNSLTGIYKNHYQSILSSDRKWHNNDRKKLIKATKGLISEHFIKSKNNSFAPGNWIKNLENIINESKTEQQSYDFKMGLINLKNNEFNTDLIDKILKTLTAMTNSIEGECTVIVGVAENEEAAKLHQVKFNKSYIKYNSKFIVGIDSEAVFLFKEIDQYLKKVKDYIRDSKNISPEFKLQILNKVSNFTYKEKEIIIFRAERGSNPQPYKDQYFERHLSHNEQVISGDAMNNLFRRFQ